jgi:ketosteroid isomerase-like protein
MPTVVKDVTLYGAMSTRNEVAKRNMETIVEFFSLYLKDKARFYSLWVTEDPEVVTPFISTDVAVIHKSVHSGWAAVKAFWDPIFDEMHGRFDWFVDEFIPGEDPDVILTRSHSKIDVQAGKTWGNKHIAYTGRYVQLFRFVDGKVKSFEEYYDTALLNSQYGA